MSEQDRTEEEIGIIEGAAVRQLQAQLKSRWKWKAHAFEVRRKADRQALGRPAKPRVVVVYSPLAETAQLGVGCAKDEQYRQVPVPVLSTLGLSAAPKRQDMADLFEAVGSSMKAGKSLRDALLQAARIIKSPYLRGIIGVLGHLNSQGYDIHIAISIFPKQFPPKIVALVAAAKEAGADEASVMYLKLAAELRNDGKIMKKFIGAVSYPLFMILMSFVGAMILATKAMPPMAELFLSMGQKLPPLTQFWYDVGRYLIANGWWVFPLAVGCVIGIFASVPVLLKKHWVQRLMVKAPFFGGIVMSIAISRSLSTFVLLKQHGAKPKQMFELAGAASGNIVIMEFFDAAFRRVAAGENMADAITAERDALGEDGQRIAGKLEAGVGGGDLDVLIGGVVEELNERADTRITILPKAINLPLLVICAAIIGSVALAITLPYPNLIADVANKMKPKQ